MRRYVLAATFATLLVLGAAAGTSMAQTVVQYANWQFLEAGRSDLLRGFIAEFEAANPDIRIEPIEVPYSVYTERMTNVLASGAGPDVLFTQEFTLVPWMKAGYLAELDELLDLSRYSFLPQQSYAQSDGKTYAVLYEGFPYGGLIINTKLFEQAGIDIPRTPEEFIEAAVALTKPPHQWGLAHPFDFSNPSYIMQGGMIVIKGFGGRIIDENGNPAVNSPEFIEGVKYLKRLYDSGGTPVGTDFRLQRDWFTQGLVAMVLDGSYWPLIVRAQNPELYKAIDVYNVPFPKLDSPYETNWYVINANSKNKKAAARFVEYLMSRKVQERWALLSGMGTGEAWTLDLVAERLPWFEAYARATPYGVVRIYKDYEEQTPQVRRMVADAIAEVMTEQATAEEAMNDLQEALVALKGR
ncbi:ABC transporter substrate-binding protein [Limnochorda pilosa]|uniref:Sugar ABC transporter n=1 Tax=Limnochorda pilosa TaxID=1555112 RepID=A0A0K2SLG9_LIMPI|nr:sugar ABC transporter substrate-binding protein [Limnochorda pilosa]BAS27852.1 sugar ABC transporter [Limnochorda pilosa]